MPENNSQPDEKKLMQELEHELNPDETPSEDERETLHKPSYSGPQFTTYHTDVAHMTNQEGAKVTSEMLREAQQEEKADEQQTKEKRTSAFLVSLSIMFLLAGVVILFILFRPSQPETDAVARLSYTSLVRSEDTSSVNVTDARVFKIQTMLEQVIQQPMPTDTIRAIYIGKEDPNGGHVLSLQELAQVLEWDVPHSLIATTEPSYMIGVYRTSSNINAPFMILPVASYPKAFSAMRTWEEDILPDMKKLFAITDELTQVEARTATFTDEVVFNKTVRSLYVPLVEEQQREVVVEEPDSIDTIIVNDIGEPNETAETTTTTDAFDEVSVEPQEELVADMPPFSDNLSEDIQVFISEQLEATTNFANVTLPNGDNAAAYLFEHDPEIMVWLEEKGYYEAPPQYATLTERVVVGNELALLYTFINENTLVITTDPEVIPEIVTRYANRILFQ